MSGNSNRGRFWTLGGIAAVITAIATLISALAAAGYLQRPTMSAPVVLPTNTTVTIMDPPSENAPAEPASPSIVSHVPEISDVSLRREESSSGPILHQDIHFRDQDGNAHLVAYELVSTTRSGIVVENDPISSPPGQQKRGDTVTGTWICGTGTYMVVLRGTILDKAGNESNPVDLTFDCR